MEPYLRPDEENIIATRKALHSTTRSSSSTVNLLGLAGRKTGITLRPENIVQDEDALDNIDTFWNAALTSPEMVKKAMLMGSTPMRTAPASHKPMTGPSHPIRDALKVASEENHEENNQNFSTPKFSSMLARVERTPTSIQSSSMSINTTRSEIVRSPLKTPLRILNLPKFEDIPDEEIIPDSQEASNPNNNMKLHSDSQLDEFNEFNDEKNNLEEVNDNLTEIHLQEEHSALFQFERTPRKPKAINELSLETAVEEMEDEEVTSIDPNLVVEYSDPPKNKEMERPEQEYPEPPSFSLIVNSPSAAVLETPRKSVNNNHIKEQHQSFKDFPEIALMHPSPGAPVAPSNHEDSIIFSYGDDGGFNGHEEEEDHRLSDTCEDSETNDGSLLLPEEQEKFTQLGRDSDSDDEEVPQPKKPRVTKLSVSLDDGESEGERQRRSHRRKFRPLEFWKNERVVYGRRESCSRLQVPAILDVITSKEAEEDIGRGKGSRADSKKQLFKQKGFHPKKSASGPVLNVTKNKESLETVMIHYENLKPKTFNNGQEEGSNHFYVYNDGFPHFKSEDASFGLLVLPKNAKKPNLNSGDFDLRFFVHSGMVKVTIHKVSFVAQSGCEFIVPFGNQYEITNVYVRESKLYYVHVKHPSDKKIRRKVSKTDPNVSPEES